MITTRELTIIAQQAGFLDLGRLTKFSSLKIFVQSREFLVHKALGRHSFQGKQIANWIILLELIADWLSKQIDKFVLTENKYGLNNFQGCCNPQTPYVYGWCQNSSDRGVKLQNWGGG